MSVFVRCSRNEWRAPRRIAVAAAAGVLLQNAALSIGSGATFHASVHEIFGTQFSANNIQSLATVSGVEAPPAVRLFNLWIEQKFGSDVNVRFGKFTAAQEFLVSENANLFVDATLGWPLLTSQDLPSGGPIIRSPARHAAGMDPDRTIHRACRYLRRRPRRTRQRRPGVARAVRARGASLPGTVKLGAMVLTGQYTEQLLGNQAGSPVLSMAPALQHSGDVIAYRVVDQMLWRVPGGPGDRALSCFMRVAAAPSDRNAVDFYLDGGPTFKGLVGSRPNDQTGLAVAYGNVSPQVAPFTAILSPAPA